MTPLDSGRLWKVRASDPYLPDVLGYEFLFLGIRRSTHIRRDSSGLGWISL